MNANAALVGVSGFGAVHYNDLSRAADAGRLRIVAATIINQDEEAAKVAALRARGTEIFGDAIKMFRAFAGKLDIVFLPVGIPLHAPLAIAAMRSGANVFVEKPLAATAREAEEIMAVERETGKFTAVAFQLMYQPPIHHIKRVIVNELGRVLRVKVLGLWPRGRSYYLRNNWAGKLRGANGEWIYDSPANNAFAHYLNLAFFFSGATEFEFANIVSQQAALFRARGDIETFDTCFIRMRAESGADLLFIASHTPEAAFEPVVVVECERGSARWTHSGYEILRDGAAVETGANTPWEAERDNCVNAVLRRLADSSAFVCEARHAAVLTRVVNTAHATTPIAQVPAEFISTIPAADPDTRVVWNGLDALAQKCFAEHRLPTPKDLRFDFLLPGRGEGI